MAVAVIAEMSSTDLNKTSGEVFDAATEGPVRVLRHDQRFVVLKEEALEAMLEAAKQSRPESLEDMLQNYDRNKIRSLTSDFLSAPPSGKELI